MPERIGQLLGHYRLIRLLGQGGFAEVYLGEHVHLNTYAAIKILHTQLAEDGLENFRTEARTLAHLKHPNIIQVLDFGLDGLMPYFVMQYAPNGTLRQRHPRGISVPLNIVVSYVRQVAAALQYAHNQKFIHRDIKPENMLVGEQNQILLSDFGIAVVTASARAENPALTAGIWSSAGTVAYMAPEQIQGQTVPASDQYALATVVYEWLTGSVPFTGSYMEVLSQHMSATPAPLRQKNPSLPQDVEQVVLTALTKDPQRRFQRVEVFAAALERVAQVDSDAPAHAQSTSNDTQRSASRKEGSSMEAALIGPFGRTVIGQTHLTIGRAPDNTIVVSDPRASSHHAEVRPEGAYFSVVDLGSTNGTFVNEQPVFAPRLLQPGDTLRIGDTKFRFEIANVSQSYAGGSTIRAAPPPPPVGAAPNFAGNTSYGAPDYGTYQATIPAPQAYTPPPQPASPPDTPSPVYTPPSQPPPGTPSPVYTPPSQPPLPKPSPLRAIVLAVIALVIILGGLGGFFVIQHNQSVYKTSLTATANANSATAAARATAQTIAQATAQANATATAIVTSHFPPFTNLASFYPLTSSSSSWPSNSICQFVSTGYQVSIQQVNVVQWCPNSSGQFGDFAFQVTMDIQQGDCGGLIFRYVDNNNFFLYEVCSNGTYNIDSVVKNHWFYGYTTDRANSAIRQGNQQNVIAVTVQGNTVNMYANGTHIDTGTDNDLTTSTFSQGSIALEAYDASNPTTVVYTNALLWTSSS
jgi:serine/threonine protein kinase